MKYLLLSLLLTSCATSRQITTCVGEAHGLLWLWSNSEVKCFEKNSIKVRDCYNVDNFKQVGDYIIFDCEK